MQGIWGVPIVHDLLIRSMGKKGPERTERTVMQTLGALKCLTKVSGLLQNIKQEDNGFRFW